jgi:hypothetical protein
MRQDDLHVMEITFLATVCGPRWPSRKAQLSQDEFRMILQKSSLTEGEDEGFAVALLAGLPLAALNADGIPLEARMCAGISIGSFLRWRVG